MIGAVATRTSSRPAVADRAQQAGHMTAPLPTGTSSNRALGPRGRSTYANPLRESADQRLGIRATVEVNCRPFLTQHRPIPRCFSGNLLCGQSSNGRMQEVMRCPARLSWSKPATLGGTDLESAAGRPFGSEIAGVSRWAWIGRTRQKVWRNANRHSGD